MSESCSGWSVHARSESLCPAAMSWSWIRHQSPSQDSLWTLKIWNQSKIITIWFPYTCIVKGINIFVHVHCRRRFSWNWSSKINIIMIIMCINRFWEYKNSYHLLFNNFIDQINTDLLSRKVTVFSNIVWEVLSLKSTWGHGPDSLTLA